MQSGRESGPNSRPERPNSTASVASDLSPEKMSDRDDRDENIQPEAGEILFSTIFPISNTKTDWDFMTAAGGREKKEASRRHTAGSVPF